MSHAPIYAFTPDQVTAAFDEITATLFADRTADAIPKLLITAGLQGSGKTYLLEKGLLKSEDRDFSNYVRLYLPEYRKKHPQYADMIKVGVLHAYEHTEAFVRQVSGKIFTEAFTRKYNIIMECAFDSIDFAAFPSLAAAAGYQLEAHIVACIQPFAHVSSINRAIKSLKKEELERFVTYSALKSSMSNAQAIILAFESAAKNVSGSQIYLYERGLGALYERTLRAHSTYTKDAKGDLSVSSTTSPYSYSVYDTIINNHVYAAQERSEMIKECHLALLKAGTDATEKAGTKTEKTPDFVYNDLYAYIVKYVYR